MQAILPPSLLNSFLTITILIKLRLFIILKNKFGSGKDPNLFWTSKTCSFLIMCNLHAPKNDVANPHEIEGYGIVEIILYFCINT